MGGNSKVGEQLREKEMVCSKYNMKDEGCSTEKRRNIEGSIRTQRNREED